MLGKLTDEELMIAYSKCLTENINGTFRQILEDEISKRTTLIQDTGRRITLNAIGTSDLDFYQLVKYSIDSIFVVQDDKVIFVNKAGFDLLGLRYPDQIIGERFFRFLHPECHESCKQKLEQVYTGEIFELMELKMFKADGDLIDVEIMAAPYLQGGLPLIQIQLRDVTSRKNVERRMNYLEKLSSIGQMAAGIAHEIRNPLTTVKGFLQLLQEEQQHTYYPIIMEELDNAIKTLNNLLQVSKPDLIDETDQSINLCSELDSLIFLFQEKLYNITVNKIYTDREIEMTGKKNLLLKAFFNLIKNAVEAIHGKGEITIKHFFKKDRICILIKDSGVGIPGEYIALLGTPFFTTKNEGTGLGLTQVFTTIHQHGGHIHVESEPGKGTEFHIELPVRSG